MKTKEQMRIDFMKLGEGAWNLVKGNSGTLVGGLCMIGMALLCKRLEIPYQVLTDPFTVDAKSKKYSDSGTKLFLVPNNAIEASMAAIYDGVQSDDWESTKQAAAEQIMAILSANKESLSENSKTYAINLIRGLAGKSRWSSTKDSMNRLIAKIGKGEF